MPTSNDVLAYVLSTSQQILHRFVDDLSPPEFLHRPTPRANCAAWLVGHLALTDRNALKRLGAALPELPEGFEKQFSRDEGCPQAAEFGDVSTLMPVFDAHRNALIAAVRAASPAELDKPLEKPHSMFKTIFEAVAYMAGHTSLHAGQITIIRRSLGKPPVV